MYLERGLISSIGLLAAFKRGIAIGHVGQIVVEAGASEENE